MPRVCSSANPATAEARYDYWLHAADWLEGLLIAAVIIAATFFAGCAQRERCEVYQLSRQDQAELAELNAESLMWEPGPGEVE